MDALARFDFSAYRRDNGRARRAFADRLGAACAELGFFYASDRDFDRGAVEAMRTLVETLFAEPHDVKMAHMVEPVRYRGYIPFGFFTPNAAKDGGARPDQYEGYKLYSEIEEQDPLCQRFPLYGPNLWLASLPGMRKAVRDYWRQLDRLADDILGALALALGIEDSYFTPFFQKPLTNMTCLHYPRTTSADGAYGIHPHTDSSAFTVIYPDPHGGLLIRSRHGAWIDVRVPEDTFVVNIGDVMSHWTGGRFLSAAHQVVNRSGCERYSFPYFATPRYDAVIEPLVGRAKGSNFEPRTMGDWHLQVVRSNWPDAPPLQENYRSIAPTPRAAPMPSVPGNAFDAS